MDQTQSSEPADLVGTVLGDRYRVEQRLSQGGMGVVYRARHIVLDSALAVKVLLKPQNDEDRQRFLQEAKLASVIKHPNTVQIVDFGLLPSGQSYLVMELMSGRVLTQDVDKGPMDALRVCQIGAQIARGLQAVHDQGIIHRDMKPDNVFLLNQDGTSDFVKIVDFGIAKSVGAAESPLSQAQKQADDPAMPVDKNRLIQTQVGMTLGTPPYMSPQQCLGEPLDGRSDQYSLGCMLYEMLVGQWVFNDSSPLRLMLAHTKTVPQRPSARAPQLKIPAALEAAVLRMLEKQPERRFQSMHEVAQTLSHAADLMLVERGEKTVLPTGILGLLGSRVKGSHLIVGGRRVPLRAATAVVLAVVVLALGSAGFFGYRLYQAQKSQKPTLEPGELQVVKARALAVLRQIVKTPGDDLAVRLDAIAALGQTQDGALRPELEALLGDSQEPVQAEAAAALGHLGDRAAAGSLRAAHDKARASLVRMAAARALVDLGDSQGELLLSQALAEGAPEQRLRAAGMLCDRHNATAEKLLLKVVDEGLLQEESAVLGALGCLLRSQSAEPARFRLRNRLKDAANPQQQIEIARVLSRAGDAEGRRVLRALAAQPGLPQLPAAQALAAPDVPQIAALFRAVLGDRQAQLAARLLSSEGLGQSGILLDVRLLDRFLVGSQPLELREAAAVAVLRIGAADPTALGAESLRWARGNLTSGDWRLRDSAALVLGDSAAPEAVTALKTMLKDKDARVRRGSVRALGRRTEDPALLALRDMLHDPDPEVRIETLRSLGRISQFLVKAGTPDVLGQARSWFGELFAKGPPREQILARALLVQLGDSGEKQTLWALRQSEDAAVRRFLLEQAPPDVEQAAAMLGDQDIGVRFAAAQLLAEAGDTRAIDTLKETLKHGGPDSIAAYGLLTKLGQTIEQPASLKAELGIDKPVAQRMAAVEAMARLPAALAVSLLLEAVHDPEPLVRRLCAEIAAELVDRSAPDGMPGFPVLRFLLGDSDAGVKNRAAVLIFRVALASAPPPKQDVQSAAAMPAAAPVLPPPTVAPPSPPSRPAPVTAQEPEETSEAGSSEVGGSEVGSEETTGKGKLVLDAPEGMVFQVDGGKWQTASSKGISLPKGEHEVKTLGGSYNVTIDGEKKTHLKLTSSPIEDAVQTGSRAYEQKDYTKAQSQYDRASSLCRRDRSHKKACEALELGLALDRGRILEQQQRPSEAMAQYQKALDAGRGKSKVQAAEALTRLAPQLGKVILRSVEKGKCKERVEWLSPGKKQKVKVGDKSQPVSVRPGQTVELGSCP